MVENLQITTQEKGSQKEYLLAELQFAEYCNRIRRLDKRISRMPECPDKKKLINWRNYSKEQQDLCRERLYNLINDF